MRATRWSLLVVVAAVLAACSGSPEAAPPNPPPAAVAPAEPGPSVAVDDVPGLPAGPGGDEAVADDPVPEGVRGRGPAAAAGPAGQVQAAARSGRPTPTGRIEIPAIGLNHVTYEGIDLATINYGPSHWPGTPLPGQLGNTVFPGHRTTYSRPFWALDKLVPGNEVIFTTAAGRFTYRVTHTVIVGPRDMWVVGNTPDATFTLSACHPKGSARQRIVVKGTMVNQPPPPTTPTTRQKILGLL